MKVGAVRGKLFFSLLFTIGMLSACANEDILQETPVTFQLDGEELLHKSIEEILPEQIDIGKVGENVKAGTVGQEDNFSFLLPEVHRYAFNSLSENEQIWYQDIEKCLGEMSDSIILDKEALRNGLDEEDINHVFQCVLIDHPELFYVEGYTYTQYTRGEKTVSIEFAGDYNVDLDAAKAKKLAIEQAAEAILVNIEGLDSDYEKIKAIYETIILSTAYQVGAEDNQNIYSVFVNHNSVCQGYAKATQYLCNLAGIDCTLVLGTVDSGMGHAWNLVNLDGNYYYVDTTWGDVSYVTEEGQTQVAEYAPEINYDYLCLTTRKLTATHTIDSKVPLPECVALEDNYYVRENAYFTEYNTEQMQALFDKMQERGKRDVTIMCADESSFSAIEAALLDEQDIFDYLDAYESVDFSLNEEQLSMTFWVTNE